MAVAAMTTLAVPWVGAPMLLAGLAWVVIVMRRADRQAMRQDAQLRRLGGIVERKVHERTMKLEDDVEQYRALVESLDAVAFEYDVKAGKLIYIAPQAATLLECDASELTPSRIMASVHRDDRTIVDAMIRRGYQDGPLDCRLLTARGHVIHTRTFVSARAGSRRVRGLLLDITREHELETELRQAQKLESVGRLAAGIAHEINSPIQYIADSIDFVRDALTDVAIEDDYLRENIPAALVRAAEGVERVARIVRSMKAFSHEKQEMAVVDVNQTVENTLTLASNEYRYVADIVTDLGAAPQVFCHSGDLQEVLLTLLVNAAQAIADVDDLGLARRGQITVTTRKERGSAVIAIADTGCGMPEHVRGQIFEPFFTTKGVGKGIGQGLAVARSLIVDRYHGSLVFESEVGHGTVFTIRLPVTEERATA